MKRITFLFLITLILSNYSYSQPDCSCGRYINEIFPTITTTSNVLYGNNINEDGNTEDLFLDIYEPTGDIATLRPLIILAHGGSFVGGDKGDACIADMCQDFTKMGYVTASINYRIGFEGWPPWCPDSVKGSETVMRATHDARAAVRFFRKNFVEGGNTYRIDTNLIFFGGSSAGALIALHLAYVDEPGELPIDTTKPGLDGGVEGNSGNPGYSSKVTAIINISGALADTAWMKAGDTPIISFHGDQDGTVPFGTDMIQLLGICNILFVDGSNSVHLKANEVGINNCFKPYWGAGHTPECGSAAYMDSSVTYTKHFLLQFVCNNQYICDYTTPANTAPLANNDAIATDTSVTVIIDVQNNDIDADSDSLTTTMFLGPNNGNALVLNNNSIQYTPNPGFIGTDTIIYIVCDNGSSPPLCDPTILCDTAMVIVIVTIPGVNTAPLANNDLDTTVQDVPVIIDVQLNDMDPDGDTLTTTILSGPNNGTAIVLNGDSIQYTPNPGFVGTDTITYQVCDNGPLCDQATLTINVIPAVGIDESIAVQNDMVFYPNPANNYIKLDMENLYGQEYTIELFDHMGRLVRKYNDQTTAEFIINREDLSSGLYFINIISGNSNYTGKIIFE